MMTFRTYRSGDLAGILAVIAEAMPLDPITERSFAATVLLDPHFDPAGLVIAEVDDRIIGFLYATSAAPETRDGYLTIGAVAPDYQRQGAGSGLLRRAMDFLQARGVAQVTVAGYPQGYFVPGVDAEAYPAAKNFLTDRGFDVVDVATAMHRSLNGYTTPPEISELIRLRENQGYRFAAAGWDDLVDILTFADRVLAPDWAGAVREAVLASARPDRICFARSPQGDVVGFATYATYEGVRERFGPFGVDPQQRGVGLGKALLHLTLDHMREEGASRAWFLWTSENSPAGSLYRASGFDVLRRFDVLRAPIHTPDSPHHRWKENR